MENVTSIQLGESKLRSIHAAAISHHEDLITHQAIDLIDKIVSERLTLLRNVKVPSEVNFYGLLSSEIRDLFDEALHRYFELGQEKIA